MAEILFRPLDTGKLTLSNRIVMSPMSRYMSPGNVPGQASADYYARRARHGVGLIITEGTYPAHPAAHGYENVPQFYGDEALAGWKNVVEAVHAEGGKIFPQLWHCGSFRESGMPPDPAVPGLSATEIVNPARPTTRPAKAMTEADIADTLDAYAKSASEAKRLGFDGIEIHAARGYLIDEFFWAKSNARDDQWGGDYLARTRFACEVLRAVRAATGPNFPISIRISQWKQQDYKARLVDNPDMLEKFLGRLLEAGADILHCSQRRYWHAEFEGSDLSLAGWAKKLVGAPVIAVGSVGLNSGSFEHSDIELLDELLRRAEPSETSSI